MPPRANHLSVADLEKMLKDRRTELDELQKSRKELRKELDQVERQIRDLAGKKGRSAAGAKRGKRRPKNAKPLHAVVADVLGRSKDGFPLSTLADKVLATGYKTGSKDFKNVLYQSLYNSKSVVHDAKTGKYRLRRTARPTSKPASK